MLSARSNRDFFFVKLLAFLELVAATLLSSNITFFVFLTTFVVFGVATFCCSEIRRSSQQGGRIAMPKVNFHGRLAALTGVITVGIVLMTSGLFILLPRTARAAFRSFVPERYHITGFANEISFGQLGKNSAEFDTHDACPHRGRVQADPTEMARRSIKPIRRPALV